MYGQNRPFVLPGFSPPSTVTKVSSVHNTGDCNTSAFCSSASGTSRSAAFRTQSHERAPREINAVSRSRYLRVGRVAGDRRTCSRARRRPTPPRRSLPAIGLGGTGGLATPSRHLRQAYLGRTWTLTSSFAGMNSSSRERSSPMRVFGAAAAGTGLFGFGQVVFDAVVREVIQRGALRRACRFGPFLRRCGVGSVRVRRLQIRAGRRGGRTGGPGRGRRAGVRGGGRRHRACAEINFTITSFVLARSCSSNRREIHGAAAVIFQAPRR